MKVVLLALSGDLARWRDKLVQLYPDSSIELISRAEFDNQHGTWNPETQQYDWPDGYGCQRCFQRCYSGTFVYP